MIRPGVMGMLTRYASRLRFPTLFLICAVVFIVDLIVPDVVPFADEIILALLTIMLGSLKRSRQSLPDDGIPTTRR